MHQQAKMPTHWADRLAAEAAVAQSSAPGATKQGDKLKAELDELLDEIDEVLEDNAEEFVRSYVQKGGE
jgi:prokaryotic ubiquitin-like protein Pup